MTARKDGRGHWPAGKRRGTTGRHRDRAVVRLRAKMSKEGWSCRGVADELGVSDRTVRRWLADEDHPTQANLDGLQRWLA